MNHDATVVSMSFGSHEFKNEGANDSIFTTKYGHPNVSFVASSGDNGYTQYPSASPNVLAVGGTSLAAFAGNWINETGWSGSGGGFSPYEAKTSFEPSYWNTSARTVPDVAYDADVNTGVAVYGHFSGQAISSWQVVGGTSAGAPQWAGLIAIANQGRNLAGKANLTRPQDLIYGMPGTAFHDVISGTSDSFFAAHPGYDLVTGRGSPKADQVVANFVSSAAPSAAPKAGGPSSAANGGDASAAQVSLMTGPGAGNTLVAPGTHGLDTLRARGTHLHHRRATLARTDARPAMTALLPYVSDEPIRELLTGPNRRQMTGLIGRNPS